METGQSFILAQVRRALRRSRIATVRMDQASKRAKFRRALRQKRALVVALLAVSGLIALLTGISIAQGDWYPMEVFQADPGRPKARFGAATTYDGSSQRWTVFGGFVGSTSATSAGVDANAVSGPPILNDNNTYLYSGGPWERRDTVRRPSARGFASMAYDGARRNVVLFGGAPYNTNNVSGETWIWDADGEGWILQNPPEPRPDPRQNAAMVYDAHRKVVVMFGGRGANGMPMDDTWTWNGSAWRIMPRSVGDPTPRHSAAIAYDECRAEAVMFGGVGSLVNTTTGRTASEPFQTWTLSSPDPRSFDGARWTLQSPKLSPPARIGAGMAYSPRTGNVLLYGGLATNEAGVPTAAIDDDVWRWAPDAPTPNGSTGWERMNSEPTTVADNSITAQLQLGDFTPKAQPPPRAYASFTYTGESPYGSLFRLYGGTPSVAPPSHGRPGIPESGGAQVAYGDHFAFGDKGYYTGIDGPGTYAAVAGDTPLTRRCVDPVPIPPDETQFVDVVAEAREALKAREGMRETDQLPVLTGTDWPEVNRNPRRYTSGSQTGPNPNYTPAPDCPNRSEYGTSYGNAETGDKAHLVTDQKRNRVYQFFICDQTRGQQYLGGLPDQPKLLIQAYDGATLKPLGRVIIASRPSIHNGANLSKLLFDDADGGRFLLRLSDSKLVVIQKDLIEKGIDPVGATFDVGGLPAGSFGDDYNATRTGYFTHPKTGRDKLLVATVAGGPTPGSPPTVTAGPPSTVTPGSPPASSTPPKLFQWDLVRKSPDWTVDLTGCSSTAFGPMRFGDRVYVICNSGVAKVAVTENAGGTEVPGSVEVFAGPVGVNEVWGDPQAERVLLNSPAGDVNTVWVFDGKASRWVGRTGVGGYQPTWGFDAQAGRLYAHMGDLRANPQTQGGVLMIDTRLTPIPQPLKLPQFAFPPAAPVASLPSTPGVPRRVFIRNNGGTMQKYPNWETVKFQNEMFYRVLADEVPLSEKTQLAQLDLLTIPVAEKPGKTEVSFDAEGSGYGIRLRSVGGIYTAVRPFQQAYAGIDDRENNPFIINKVRPLVPACMFPDRELMAGWVLQAHLSDLDAVARTSGLEVDSNSKTDLQGPFSRCNPTANASDFPATITPVFDVLWPLWQLVQLEGNKAASAGTVELGKDADGNMTSADGSTTATVTPLGTLERGVDKDGKPTLKFDSPASTGWNNYFKEVECVGDALATNTATVGNIYGSAKCVQRQGMVEATARGSAPGVGPAGSAASSAGFSVGEGYSNVTVARDPVKGVVVTSTAIAKGIELPGITIGYVKTEAVAWSNGRPGEKRASFTRKICNVDRDPPIPINPPDLTKDDRAPSTGCLTENQQKAMVKNWNDRWGINSKMYLPKYDPEYFQGSPGGYIAGVIKPIADETEDQLFAKDVQREVAGLVIDFYKDSLYQGNARQTLQLAAVRAVTGFGVQCNPDHIYSPQSKDCLVLSFEDDLLVEEFEEEEESDDSAFNSYEDDSDGGWVPVEALGPPEGLALGKRIGQFIQNLPVLRRLPIRQMGEALLAASVWLLFLLPPLLASRRFALNLARRSQ